MLGAECPTYFPFNSAPLIHIYLLSGRSFSLNIICPIYLATVVLAVPGAPSITCTLWKLLPDIFICFLNLLYFITFTISYTCCLISCMPTRFFSMSSFPFSALSANTLSLIKWSTKSKSLLLRILTVELSISLMA